MIKDIFNKNIINPIDFSGIFEGYVLSNDSWEKDYTLDIYLSEFMINDIIKDRKLEYTEVINRENILNKDQLNINNTIKSTNGIKCYCIGGSYNIKPDIGDRLLVIFIDEDPQKPYYINLSLLKESNKKKSNIIYKDKDTVIEKNKELIIMHKESKIVMNDKGINIIGKVFINGKEM